MLKFFLLILCKIFGKNEQIIIFGWYLQGNNVFRYVTELSFLPPLSTGFIQWYNYELYMTYRTLSLFKEDSVVSAIHSK